MSYTLRHAFSSLMESVLRKYPNDLFIETGTNVGLGVELALRCGFPAVISIEADPDRYADACALVGNDPRVRLLFGDSSTLLADLCKDLVEPCTFYLDAHTVGAIPLIAELAAIATSPCKTHTILIDDVRMFGSAAWCGLSKTEILRAVFRINPAYVLSYEDTPNARADLLVASFVRN